MRPAFHHDNDHSAHQSPLSKLLDGKVPTCLGSGSLGIGPRNFTYSSRTVRWFVAGEGGEYAAVVLLDQGGQSIE